MGDTSSIRLSVTQDSQDSQYSKTSETESQITSASQSRSGRSQSDDSNPQQLIDVGSESGPDVTGREGDTSSSCCKTFCSRVGRCMNCVFFCGIQNENYKR